MIVQVLIKFNQVIVEKVGTITSKNTSLTICTRYLNTITVHLKVAIYSNIDITSLISEIVPFRRSGL